MINRRLIRIKAFQALFGEYGQEHSRPSVVVNQVQKSIHGLGTNFLAVLCFGPEFNHFISSEHNPTEFKFKPKDEDLKSFQLFTENIFFNDLETDKKISNYRARPTFDWQQEKDIMFLIFKELKKTPEYKEVMASDLSPKTQTDFALFIYKYLLLHSVEFEQLMEDKNIVWYDEKIPILKSIEGVLAEYEKSQTIVLPELFKNETEDLQMSEDLILKYFEHRTELEASLEAFTPGWDSERITKIDHLLMIMALLEFKYMPMIPVKVSLNEYIEIAKMYSTPKSSKFVNGTLDKILKDWNSKELIKKKGRGLIG
jgi:transcription antitermination protein NusB